jgi:hypothetical protein
MNMQSFVATTRTRVAATALAAAGTLLSLALSAHAAWEHAHGDSANTGLARVDTARAVTPQRSVALGEIALGANPVIAPDGTVYIGNLEGELMAFHPDGTLYWKRQLNNLHGSIFAAPVVGADGSVYVVSCKKTIYNDHRDGADTHRVVLEAYLHKFNASGAWLFTTPFPVQFGTNPTTIAPPNIWRWNGTEAIMGQEASTSVTNSFGQTHDVSNLFVAGPSLFPTGGAVNPTLTIYALTQRTVSYMLDNWDRLA